MDFDDLDLEDIESRLYSQVHHVNAEFKETTYNLNFSENYCKKRYRYFEEKLDTSASKSPNVILVLSEENNTSNEETSCNHNPLIPLASLNSSSDLSTTSNNQKSIENITIDQYSSPLLKFIEPSFQSNFQPCLPSWFKYEPLDQDILNNDKTTIQERKKKNVKKLRMSKRLKKIRKPTVTIYLSDSDSDDCVIIDNMNNNKQNEINTKFPKKYDATEGGKAPEQDDDIIFVPPPPVEVINVDLEECPTQQVSNSMSTKEVTHKFEGECNEIEIPESTLSNDFLDNSNFEANPSDFNFSLHGSDFNNGQTDTSQHKKPNEYCETESSCSTNEQSREFCNTVKTIVFDEVEFPREDIFSDKNLETFGSFITPKRTCFDKTQEYAPKTKIPLLKNNEIDISSDSSSSESDYESKANKKTDNLPNLSPMVPNISNKNKKNVHDFFKSKTPNQETEIASNIDPAKQTEATKIKKNKDFSKEPEKSKRKKRNSVNNDASSNSNLDEENVIIEDTFNKLEENDSNTPIISKTKKKKKKRDSNLEIDTTSSDILIDQNFASNEDVIQDLHLLDANQENQKSKKKKKKRENSENRTSDRVQELVDDQISQEEVINNYIKDVELTQDLVYNCERKKRKKKKKNYFTEDETLDTLSAVGSISKPDIPLTEKIPINTEKQKKKNESLTNENKEDSNNNAPRESGSQENNSIVSGQTELVECIVVDSTDSSDSDVELVLNDSEYENDFQILHDVSTDLSLNCSTSEPKLMNTNINQNDVVRILEKTQVPLDNYEQFDVKTIQSLQTDNPAKWQISYKDMLYYNPNHNKGPRCRRCKRFGHTGYRCPDKPNPPSCTLCGRPDHQEPRCPNKRCMQCGARGDYSTTFCKNCFQFRHSICRMCQMPGHIQKFCPDLWRRYHVTNDGPIIISSSESIPRNEQWCSGCAKRGHLEHECEYYNRQYPPSTPFIMNYTDVLNQHVYGTTLRTDPPSQHTVNSQIVDPIMTESVLNNTLNFIPPNSTLPANINRLVLPHTGAPNLTIQVANNPAPNDILLQMMLNFNNPNNIAESSICNNHLSGQNNDPHFQVNEPHDQNIQPSVQDNQPKCNNEKEIKPIQNVVINNYSIPLNDMDRVEHFILTGSSEEVNKFISIQINNMNKCNLDSRILKRKIFKYHRMTLNKKEMSESVFHEMSTWYRTINTYIFGVHKLMDGKLHVNFMTRHLKQANSSQLNEHRRKSLFSSYRYIFGSQKRPNVNYYKLIRLLIRKQTSNKV